MANESKEYQCPKCGTTCWSVNEPKFCVCGGLLYSVDGVKDLLNEIFDGFKKGTGQ
jgi:hypothetical protein